jgi:hypothetical protein
MSPENFTKTLSSEAFCRATNTLKIDFGWGSAPDHAGGAFSAPSDPLAVFEGWGGSGVGQGGRRWEGAGREGEGKQGSR